MEDLREEAPHESVPRKKCCVASVMFPCYLVVLNRETKGTHQLYYSLGSPPDLTQVYKKQWVAQEIGIR